MIGQNVLGGVHGKKVALPASTGGPMSLYCQVTWLLVWANS